MDIELIKNAEPKEKVLCSLIETDLLGVIADECCPEDDIAKIINAAYLYRTSCGRKIKLYLIGNESEYIQNLIRDYNITGLAESIKNDDHDMLLSCFLGSQAIVTSDAGSPCALLAEQFYLPRIVLADQNENKLENGALYTPRDPSAVCAALMVTAERKYADELSGFKRLV